MMTTVEEIAAGVTATWPDRPGHDDREGRRQAIVEALAFDTEHTTDRMGTDLGNGDTIEDDVNEIESTPPWPVPGAGPGDADAFVLAFRRACATYATVDLRGEPWHNALVRSGGAGGGAGVTQFDFAPMVDTFLRCFDPPLPYLNPLCPLKGAWVAQLYGSVTWGRLQLLLGAAAMSYTGDRTVRSARVQNAAARFFLCRCIVTEIRHDYNPDHEEKQLERESILVHEDYWNDHDEMASLLHRLMPLPFIDLTRVYAWDDMFDARGLQPAYYLNAHGEAIGRGHLIEDRPHVYAWEDVRRRGYKTRECFWHSLMGESVENEPDVIADRASSSDEPLVPAINAPVTVRFATPAPLDFAAACERAKSVFAALDLSQRDSDPWLDELVGTWLPAAAGHASTMYHYWPVIHSLAVRFLACFEPALTVAEAGLHVNELHVCMTFPLMAYFSNASLRATLASAAEADPVTFQFSAWRLIVSCAQLFDLTVSIHTTPDLHALGDRRLAMVRRLIPLEVFAHLSNKSDAAFKSFPSGMFSRPLCTLQLLAFMRRRDVDNAFHPSKWLEGGLRPVQPVIWTRIIKETAVAVYDEGLSAEQLDAAFRLRIRQRHGWVLYKTFRAEWLGGNTTYENEEMPDYTTNHGLYVASAHLFSVTRNGTRDMKREEWWEAVVVAAHKAMGGSADEYSLAKPSPAFRRLVVEFLLRTMPPAHADALVAMLANQDPADPFWSLPALQHIKAADVRVCFLHPKLVPFVRASPAYVSARAHHNTVLPAIPTLALSTPARLEVGLGGVQHIRAAEPKISRDAFGIVTSFLGTAPVSDKHVLGAAARYSRRIVVEAIRAQEAARRAYEEVHHPQPEVRRARMMERLAEEDAAFWRSPDPDGSMARAAAEAEAHQREERARGREERQAFLEDLAEARASHRHH